MILKVGADSIATSADWDRALRANQGKPVQVTILRDRKQQTLTLQVDSKHHHAELEDLFPDSDCPLMAALDPDVASELAQQLAGNDSAVQSMQNQAEALRDQLGSMKLEINPEQAEQFRKQAEKLRESLNAGDFQFDQKQLDQLKQQMKQFQGNFKLDPRQTDELRQQMEQMRRQMEEMQARSFGQFV